jgi:hypothetical protein
MLMILFILYRFYAVSQIKYTVKLLIFLHKPCQRLLFHKKADVFHVSAVILSAFSRNPKFANRHDVPWVALGSIAGPYARQNGLADRFNAHQKAAG